MKLTLADSKLLKDSISVISELINEAVIRVTPDMLQVISMDDANVAMLNLKMFSSCFVEYDVKSPEDLSLNLNSFKTVLKRSGPNDILTLESEKNKLKVTITGKTNRIFYLPIIDYSDKKTPEPKLSYESSAVLNTSEFSSYIDDCLVVGESIQFLNESGEKLIMRDEGNLSQVKVEIEPDETTKLMFGDTFKAKFSSEYLKKISSAAKLTDEVKLEFKSDYPLRVTFKAVDKISLTYVLAPRIDNN